MSCFIPSSQLDIEDMLRDALIRRIQEGIKIIDGGPATQILEDYVYLEEGEHVWFNTETQEVRISKEEDLP